MKSRWKAALCLGLMAAFVGPTFAQQKRDLNDSQKVRRLDITPEPAPAMHPRVYPGTSFRSLRTPELDYGYVAANNKNFFYEKLGYGTENIVVVHGGPGLPHNYLIPALQPLGQQATVWFYDARGHGLSEHNYPAEPYSMEELVDDLDAFIKAAGLRNVTILGHSFGGMVALEYATREPEDLRRLILVDTAPSVGYASEFEAALKRVMPSSQYERYEATRRDESVTPDERLRRSLRAVYPYYWYHAPKDYYLDQDIKSMNLNSLAADQIWESDGMKFDVRDKLSGITVPTLVMVGRHDIVMSVDQAKVISDGIPGARLVVFERSGVYPFYEENALFTDYVKFFLQYYAV